MATYNKQPLETLDYDVDFSDWLDTDTITSMVVSAATGITVASSSNPTNKTAKVWITGGTSGTTYKITVRITTAAGRVKEADFNIAVLEL